MATIDEIKQSAVAIRDATEIGENTAERVGGVLVSLLEVLTQLQTDLSGKADSSSLKEANEAIGLVSKSVDVLTKNMSQKLDKSTVSQALVNDDTKIASSSAVYSKIEELTKSVGEKIAEIKKEISDLVIPKLAHMTEPEYESLENKDDETYYFLTEE